MDLAIGMNLSFPDDYGLIHELEEEMVTDSIMDQYALILNRKGSTLENKLNFLKNN